MRGKNPEAVAMPLRKIGLASDAKRLPATTQEKWIMQKPRSAQLMHAIDMLSREYGRNAVYLARLVFSSVGARAVIR